MAELEAALEARAARPDRGRSRRDGDARRDARARAGIRPPPAADAVRSPADRRRWRSRPRRLDAEARDLEARREPARQASEAQREAARRAQEALERRRARRTSAKPTTRRRWRPCRRSSRNRTPRARPCWPRSRTLAALRQARDNAAGRARSRRRRPRAAGHRVARAGRRGRARRRGGAAGGGVARRAHGRRSSRPRARASEAERAAGGVADLARIACTWRSGTRQRELAAVEARLRSLEELEASRATFGDAARLLLAEAGFARAPARRRRRSPDRRALVRARGGRAARRHAPARGGRSRGDVTEALGARGARKRRPLRIPGRR